MKRLLFFIYLLAVACGFSKAQIVSDPTTWTYEVRKSSGTEYELIFKVSLKEGWHIFSVHPGEDFLIPPSFKLDKTEDVTAIGAVKEQGRLITKTMEGLDNPVHYFEGSAVFVQKIKIRKPGVKIKGKQTYQVCNEVSCLAPKTVPFEFEVK